VWGDSGRMVAAQAGCGADDAAVVVAGERRAVITTTALAAAAGRAVSCAARVAPDLPREFRTTDHMSGSAAREVR